MCGHVQAVPSERTTESPPQQRQRARTSSKGSLAGTVDVDGLSGTDQVLVGFVAVYVNEQPAGVFWPIYSGETVLGRAGGGQQADIALNAPSVSARHARIVANPGAGPYTLHDAGSRNGTELNGVKLRAGEGQPLRDDANIKLGLVTLVVKLLPRSGTGS